MEINMINIYMTKHVTLYMTNQYLVINFVIETQSTRARVILGVLSTIFQIYRLSNKFWKHYMEEKV